MKLAALAFLVLVSGAPHHSKDPLASVSKDELIGGLTLACMDLYPNGDRNIVSMCAADYIDKAQKLMTLKQEKNL
jgi:hypothetical protein